ncbi:MAG TPA: M20/M25/M40 family metallo-hydrolase [Pseudomonadales bacterium]|nr:M20/M25/M40 family metallo-hydrolase [Pseudomonadales bacterium]
MNRVRLAVVCTLLALGAVTLRASAGIAAEHLAQAVRFPTISHQDTSLVDTDAFLALHEFLRATYPLTFATLEVEVVNDLSLLLIWRGSETAARPILFTSHMDVVPVEPGTEEEWTHPAFDGVIDDGIIYGRGTLDDKLGVISLLEATERLLGEGFAPQRTVVLAFGHDEEVLGFNGAARLAERMRELGLHFEWMVDEGGLILTDAPQLPQRKMANVNVAEKTYYTLRLAATGEGGHSSMPPAHTSIGKLAAALARIEEHPFEARLEEPVRSMLTGLAAHVDFPDSLILSNLWITSPLVIRMMEQQRATSAMVRTTTAITIFNGGVKENVVPQKAEAFVNFRLLPGDTVESVRARIIELVDDSDITVEPVSEQARTPPIADMEGGGFRVIAEAVGRSYPDAVILPGLLNGATDIRHYVDLADNHYRFHGAAMSIADTSGIHGTDEKLGVDSFERTVDIAVEMIRIGSD